MVRILGFHFWGQGSVPGWGTKIPQAGQCGWKTPQSKSSINGDGTVFSLDGIYQVWDSQHEDGKWSGMRLSWVYLCVSCSVNSDSCDPIDCSLAGSSVLGILQARILEWAAISFSVEWKYKKNSDIQHLKLLSMFKIAHALSLPPSPHLHLSLYTHTHTHTSRDCVFSIYFCNVSKLYCIWSWNIIRIYSFIWSLDKHFLNGLCTRWLCC